MEYVWPMGLTVERGKIRELATAIRATDSAFGVGPSVEGVKILVAPPTYPVVLNHWGVSGSQILTELQCNMKRVLHGEESYEYPNGPLREGQSLRGEMRLASEEVKQNRSGGELRILKFRTELNDVDSGVLAVAVTRTIIEKL